MHIQHGIASERSVLRQRAAAPAHAAMLGSHSPSNSNSGFRHVAVKSCSVHRAADIFAVDGDGCAPLHWAALEQERELVQLLLDAGADTLARDRHGFTPLQWALRLKRALTTRPRLL
jgi:ankyrin repeat protein